jgi:hypothetical protein
MNPPTVTPTWADLNVRLLDLLCPLCSQVIHMGLRGRVPHDIECRSAPKIRTIVDSAEEDIWGSQHDARITRESQPSHALQITNRLRQSCLLGVPLSTSVRRPGVGWALLAPSEEVHGPGQSLAHWSSLGLSRAGMIPPGRAAILRATVELSRVRYNCLHSLPNDSLIQELCLDEENVLSRVSGTLTHPCSNLERPPTRWHMPGSLVTLRATNISSISAAVDVIILFSVHFAGCEAPP